VSRQADLPASTRSGVYSGLLGLVVTLVELADLLGEEEWREATRGPLDELVRSGPTPGGVDVIMGSAGAIPVLLALGPRLEDPRLEELAVRHGDALLALATRTPTGWSWDTLGGASPRHLTGFAHGAAGIAWALLELHAATGTEVYRRAAEEAFRYEQSLFDPRQNNWPDLRDLVDVGIAPGTPVFAVAWCHGAPGIGLSRLRACQLLGPSTYRPQAEAALRTTRAALLAARSAAGDYSPCYGIAGLADLLLYAGEVLPDSGVRREVEACWEEAATRYVVEGQPWPCGVRGSGEAPGLMLGLSGIGYFLLRLASPEPPPPVTMIGPAFWTRGR
jgi:lantibiotic biosynthesis protein